MAIVKLEKSKGTKQEAKNVGVLLIILGVATGLLVSLPLGLLMVIIGGLAMLAGAAASN